MIVHQAPGETAGAARGGGIVQQFQIEVAIVVTEENRHAPIATLGDVVRHTGDDDPGEPGHAGAVTGNPDRSQLHILSPEFPVPGIPGDVVRQPRENGASQAGRDGRLGHAQPPVNSCTVTVIRMEKITRVE